MNRSKITEEIPEDRIKGTLKKSINDKDNDQIQKFSQELLLLSGITRVTYDSNHLTAFVSHKEHYNKTERVMIESDYFTGISSEQIY